MYRSVQQKALTLPQQKRVITELLRKQLRSDLVVLIGELMNRQPGGFVTRLIPTESETSRHRELQNIFQVLANHVQASAISGAAFHIPYASRITLYVSYFMH